MSHCRTIPSALTLSLLVTVFQFSGASPVLAQCEVQKLTAADGAANVAFGASVSISGEVAVFGARGDDCGAGFNCGAAYVYRFDGTNWVEEQKLTASDVEEAERLFGISVSISGDVAVVGAIRDDCSAGFNCGAAYVYRFDGTSWVEEQKLTASDAEGGDGISPGDEFGYSVSISGDVAIVGAWLKDCPGQPGCGAAYVYRFDGTSWVEEQKLTATVSAAFDHLGVSVSISGDVAIAGATGVRCDPFRDVCGAAYVFRFDGTRWVEEQKLTASDADAIDVFGRSVSISGDLVIVGADLVDCPLGINCGAAYVYRFDGSDWLEEAKLVASDAGDRDGFGISVSINGNTAGVGAWNDDCDAGSFCGAAYVYYFDGKRWTEQQKLTASDAADRDSFGRSVAIDRDFALVGSPNHDDAGNSSGAAYIYAIAGPDCNENGIVDACDIAAGTDICILPPDPGPCDSICPRFFYNACTGQCEAFTYGCCGGNANNFLTPEECEAACSTEPIPAFSTWGLIVMSLFLLAAGTLVIRRGRVNPL